MTETPLFARKYDPVTVGGVSFSRENCVLIAGPCSVESEEQFLNIAREIKKLGLNFIRGSAFKPRTSPYSFQGLGSEGLAIIHRVRKATGLKSVTEVLDVRDIEAIAEHCDMLQIGSRNMHNTSLLKELGKIRKPILLKRGFGANYEEWLMAAEYILSEGNTQIVLCERGIRGFESDMRYTLDLAAVPYIQQKTHLSIVVDPSHATGNRDYVPSMALAALAAGADGLLIESAITPDQAVSDSKQTISIATLADIVRRGREIAKSLGKNLI